MDWSQTSSGSGAGFDEEHYNEDWGNPFYYDDSEVHDGNSNSFSPWPTTDMQDESVFYQGDAEFGAYAVDGAAFGSDLHKGEKMNTKIPPAFDGYMPWWSSAELVKDWCEITVIEAKARALGSSALR